MNPKIPIKKVVGNYHGVRLAPSGNFEISYYPFKGAKVRINETIEAKTPKEAFYIRAERIQKAKKEHESVAGSGGQLSVGFAAAWQEIHRGLQAENLPRKTICRYEKIYHRLFDSFRQKEFPQVERWDQLSLPFFLKYQNYFCIDLGRQGGWRSELIVIKALSQRAYKLGFCQEQLLKDLKQIKRPRRKKREYSEIPDNKIKELLRYIKKENSDYYFPIYFICRTGRRIEETTLIEKRDVVWDGIRPVKIDIRAETTKRKEKAPLKDIPADLENLIRQAYLNSKKHKAPFLFLNRLNRKCQQTRISDCLKAASEKTVGVKITPHYFRHRFFTESGKRSLPMTDVMEISGLKDVKVLLEYYSHGTIEGRRKVFDETSIS